MPIYMKFGDIQGSVTEDKHSKWIEVMSFQWGVGRGITSPTGSTDDREASSPSVSEIVVTKQNDVASIGLLQATLGGQDPLDVQIDFTQTSGSGGAQRVFLMYKLKNTLVSGYSTSSGGSDRPSESITLNFTEIHVESTPAGADNKQGTAPKMDYHIGKAKLTS